MLRQAEADPFLGRAGAENFADDAGDALLDRADRLGDQTVERGGGLSHLAGDEDAVPLGALGIEQVGEEAENEGAQARGARVRQIGGSRAGCGLVGAFEDAVVKRLLVVEVIVHRGEIGAGLAGDLAHGRGVEAVLGKDASGGIEDKLAVSTEDELDLRMKGQTGI